MVVKLGLGSGQGAEANKFKRTTGAKVKTKAEAVQWGASGRPGKRNQEIQENHEGNEYHERTTENGQKVVMQVCFWELLFGKRAETKKARKT